MKALEIYRSVPRYIAARSLAARVPALAGVAPLRLIDKSAPTKPTQEWARLRPILSGICGSDLATVGGHSSFYFSPLVSMPFTPGHEVVAELLEDVETVFDGPLKAGQRVVLDPQLPCATRGVEPCEACLDGQPSRCDQVTLGHVSPGLQTGYCKDTGGGWSGELVAHPSQLHAVPDDLSDERAVLVEPLACAVRVAERAAPRGSDSVVIIGAGAVGLLTLLALRGRGFDGRITVVAKYPKQAALAHDLGATAVVGPAEITRSVRRNSHAVVLKPERGTSFLMGGADIVIECAGSSSGLDSALRITRAGGRIVLAGLPAGGADLTPLWFRELSLEGAYSGGPDAFRTALTLAADPRLAALPTSFHPLRHYREALEEAANAGKLGVGKVGFDLRDSHTTIPVLRSVT